MPQGLESSTMGRAFGKIALGAGFLMAIDKIFYGYMALAGLVAGAVLVGWPATAEIAIKPYFWMLLAVALFDGFLLVSGKGVAAMTMQNRVAGFVGGAVLMVAITIAAGATVSWF